MEENNKAPERCQRNRAMTSGGLGKPPPGSWENHPREAQQSSGSGQDVELLSKRCSCEDALQTLGHGSSAGKAVGKMSSAVSITGCFHVWKDAEASPCCFPASSQCRQTDRERENIKDGLTWKLQISLPPASEYNLVFSLTG